MEERTFDRNDVDHVKADQCGVELARDVECVRLRVAGVFRAIDADRIFFIIGCPVCDL